MAIRFTCTACQKTMKLADGIAEPKKVRCSGCGIVILLTPDPNDPSNVKASFPKKTDRVDSHSMSASQQKAILLSILGVIVLFFVLVFWFNRESGPPERAAVDGEVTLDDKALEKGKIVFTFKDDTKEFIARADIKNGRFSIGASSGPGIGGNKVEITGGPEDTIIQKEHSADIQAPPTANTLKFELKSK